jgi:hypothetical protein
MDIETIIIGIVGGGLSIALGWVAKNKSDKLVKVKTLIATVSEALKDNKITNDEMQEIFDQIKNF